MDSQSSDMLMINLYDKAEKSSDFFYKSKSLG